jgi:hypothetical protein
MPDFVLSYYGGTTQEHTKDRSQIYAYRVHPKPNSHITQFFFKKHPGKVYFPKVVLFSKLTKICTCPPFNGQLGLTAI